MHKLIVDIFQGILLTGGPDIPILIPIPLDGPINRGNQNIAPYIKLALIIQEGFFHVFLYKRRRRPSLTAVTLNKGLYLQQGTTHSDAIPTVGILPRLAYPYVPRCLGIRLPALQKAQVLCIFQTLRNHVRLRQVVTHIHALILVVLPHVGEQQFLGMHLETPWNVVDHHVLFAYTTRWDGGEMLVDHLRETGV